MTIGRIPSVEGGIQPTIVTAKGDLIVATGNATLTRQPVGSDGQVLVADSTQADGVAWQSVATPFAAGKNKIINGDFNINQRNFTSTTLDNTYGFDRWVIVRSGGTVTYSAQTFTPGSAPVAGYEAANFARVQTSGQTSTATYTLFTQKIEDVRTFAGQTVTASFWAKANSGTPRVSVEFEQFFGTGGSPWGNVTTYAGQVTLSTTWARYSVTVTIPSISGRTIGTNPNSSFINLNLWVSGGSDFNARTGSLGIQTNSFDFWGVQVEAGSVATPFTTATGTLQGELAACQRYYYRSNAEQTGDVSAYALYGTGLAETTGQTAFYIKHPVRMRVKPTAFEFSQLASFDGVTITGSPTGTNQISANSTADIAYVTFTKAGSFTQFRPAFLINNNNNAGYIAFSAEL